MSILLSGYLSRLLLLVLVVTASVSLNSMIAGAAGQSDVELEVLPIDCLFEIVDDGSNDIIYLTPEECGQPLPVPGPIENPDIKENPYNPIVPLFEPGYDPALVDTTIQDFTPRAITPNDNKCDPKLDDGCTDEDNAPDNKNLFSDMPRAIGALITNIADILANASWRLTVGGAVFLSIIAIMLKVFFATYIERILIIAKELLLKPIQKLLGKIRNNNN